MGWVLKDCDFTLSGRAREAGLISSAGLGPRGPLPPCALSPQCSPWPDVVYQVNSASSPSYNGSPSSFGLGEGYVHPLSFESSKVTTGADSFLSFLSVSSLLL